MGAWAIDRVVGRLDGAVSALFGGAVGYSAYLVLKGVFEPALAYGCSAGAIGAWISWRTLAKASAGERDVLLPPFELRAVEFDEPEELLLNDLAETGELLLTERVEAGELLLSDADRLVPAAPEPLVLDDILAEMDPDRALSACSTAAQCRPRDNCSRESMAIFGARRIRPPFPTHRKRCPMRWPNFGGRFANRLRRSALR